MAVMGERQIARAEIAELPQPSDLPPDAKPVLDRRHDAEHAVPPGRLDLVRRHAQSRDQPGLAPAQARIASSMASARSNAACSVSGVRRTCGT